MRKVPIFKLQVGKVFFGQTIDGQSVISPLNIYHFKLIYNAYLVMLFVIFSPKLRF